MECHFAATNLNSLWAVNESIFGDYIALQISNQRINGPVNAHLISGPSISINHTKPDQNA